MTRVVLSIGSNMGDRLARLRAVVEAVGSHATAVSPVFETDAWGVTDQDPFLNAVVIADDPERDARGWLALAHRLENANGRVRDRKWGPRTLDVDIVTCSDDGRDVISDDPVLTLPHPLAHQRAFVLLPWLAADSGAELTVAGRRRPVRDLLDALDPTERVGVRPTPLALSEEC